jgi:hypothetical protein
MRDDGIQWGDRRCLNLSVNLRQLPRKVHTICDRARDF